MQNRTQIKNTGYFVMTKSLGAVDNFDKLAEHSLAKRHRTTFTDVCLNLTKKPDSFIVFKNTKDVEYLNERLFHCGDNWKEKETTKDKMKGVTSNVDDLYDSIVKTCSDPAISEAAKTLQDLLHSKYNNQQSKEAMDC